VEPEDPRLPITEWVGVAGFVWVAGVDAGFVGAAAGAGEGALWLLVSTEALCAPCSAPKRPAAAAATRPPAANASTPECMNQGRLRSIGSGDANSGCSADHARLVGYRRRADVGAVASNSAAARDATVDLA